jgi:hypothetical protein
MLYFLMIFAVIAILVGVFLRRIRWAETILGVGIGIVVSLSLSKISIQGIFGPGSEWFWAMAQFIVVAVTLLFAAYQLNLQRLSNAFSSIFALREQWKSQEMCYCRKAICENQNQSTFLIGANEGAVLGFFEEIGVYLKSGVFGERIIWDLYSYWIEHYWLIFKPSIQAYRKKTSDKTYFENFESLYERMSNINRRLGIQVEKSDERLQSFRQGEIEEFNNKIELRSLDVKRNDYSNP